MIYLVTIFFLIAFILLLIILGKLIKRLYYMNNNSIKGMFKIIEKKETKIIMIILLVLIISKSLEISWNYSATNYDIIHVILTMSLIVLLGISILIVYLRNHKSDKLYKKIILAIMILLIIFLLMYEECKDSTMYIVVQYIIHIVTIVMLEMIFIILCLKKYKKENIYNKIIICLFTVPIINILFLILIYGYLIYHPNVLLKEALVVLVLQIANIILLIWIKKFFKDDIENGKKTKLLIISAILVTILIFCITLFIPVEKLESRYGPIVYKNVYFITIKESESNYQRLLKEIQKDTDITRIID